MNKRPRLQKARIHQTAHSVRTALAEIDWDAFTAPAPSRDTWLEVAANVFTALFDQALVGTLPATRCPPFQPTSDFEMKSATIRARLIQFVDVIDSWHKGRDGESAIPLFCLGSCPAHNLPPPQPPRAFAEQSVEAVPLAQSISVQTEPCTTSPIPAPTTPLRPAQAAGPGTASLSYAGVAAKSLKDTGAGSHPTRSRHKGHSSNPRHAPPRDPVRLVLRFGGKPPDDLRSTPHTEVFRQLSLALSLHSHLTGTQLLGAHWNKANNLILSFPPGSPERALSSAASVVRTTLRLPDSVPISRVTPWSKLLVSSVVARDCEGSPTFSEDTVQQSFLANPALKDLVITHPPCWIRNPASITGAHSSFTFSFEDQDGSVTRALLRAHLFVLGAPVTVKKWIDRPAARPRPSPPDVTMST
ncbi:hypothetical protein BDV93DRAFT_527414 [Ceratobasidium sp. AG-I]|nr:hypothetical protein BDV93DRAFT_527414 [Ceratobasidium sp. AG-I]